PAAPTGARLPATAQRSRAAAAGTILAALQAARATELLPATFGAPPARFARGRVLWPAAVELLLRRRVPILRALAVLGIVLPASLTPTSLTPTSLTPISLTPISLTPATLPAPAAISG